eukprot:1886780-Amphidinium_carterae.1
MTQDVLTQDEDDNDGDKLILDTDEARELYNTDKHRSAPRFPVLQSQRSREIGTPMQFHPTMH